MATVTARQAAKAGRPHVRLAETAMGQDFRPGPLPLVELPGIETGVQPRLTSENNGCDDLRQRETTRRAVRI